MITINGAAVLHMKLAMPLLGTWVAMGMEAISEGVITGSVVIEQEGAEPFVGVVVPGRSGVIGGICRFDVVGGTGGLRGNVPSRSYQRAKASTVIAELLAACGETLDVSSTRAVLATQLTYWTRGGGRASSALSMLCDAVGARWRVLPNGKVWVGTETWPAAVDDYDAEELDRDDAAQRVLLAPETIALRPGVTLEGRNVGRVEHEVGRDCPLRTTFWWVTA